MLINYQIFDKPLSELDNRKLLITTINAHSYNVTKQDPHFAKSLSNSEVLIPDGVSVVWAMKWLAGIKLKKIAGADLFFYEMERMEQIRGKVFFLGSSQQTLDKIKERARKDYPNVQVECYSPPYKPSFTDEENSAMLKAVNDFKPDVLFVGMTAPKQEKWAYDFKHQLDAGHIGCIGAVFDFYAGTIKRAPQFMIKIGLEWFYRFAMEPRRLWKRYLIGNTKFMLSVLSEKPQARKLQLN